MATIVQTFYVDPAAVQQASHVLISSIDLYFKSKPSETGTSSGIQKPGVTVSICPVENDSPVIAKRFNRVSRRGFDDINTSNDSSLATSFGFSRPIVVVPGQSYGVIVTSEDDAYSLWQHVTGDRLIGTNNVSPGLTGARDGKFFQSSAVGTQAVTDVALRFRVNIADFTETTSEVQLVNDGFEFFSIAARTAVFQGGEQVFANTAPIAGTVSTAAGSLFVTGSGTSFTNLAERQKIVLQSGTSYHVNQIQYITNNTHLELSKPSAISNTVAVLSAPPVGTLNSANYRADTITLSSSNATTALRFAAGQLIRGETSNTTCTISAINDVNVDELVTHLGVISNADASTNLSYSLAFSNGTNYVVNTAFTPVVTSTKQELIDKRYNILSRSNEVVQDYIHADDRSGMVKVAITSNHRFAAPMLNLLNSDLVVHSHSISANTHAAYANTVVYDTEIGKGGTGKARHLTTKMTFDQGRQAENIRVFLSAWKPAGTEVQVYAKFLNSSDNESFDDKAWSPLTLSSAPVNSSVADKNDVREYEYGLPLFANTLATVNNSFTTTFNSAVLTATGAAPNGQVAVGQTVRLYSPLFPTNYTVSTITAVSATTITLAAPIANNNVTGNGMALDIVRYPTVAFTNKENDYTLRYFATNGSAYDKYNTVQVKVVLVSNTTNIVPFVDQVEVIGVSA